MSLHINRLPTAHVPRWQLNEALVFRTRQAIAQHSLVQCSTIRLSWSCMCGQCASGSRAMWRSSSGPLPEQRYFRIRRIQATSVSAGSQISLMGSRGVKKRRWTIGSKSVRGCDVLLSVIAPGGRGQRLASRSTSARVHSSTASVHDWHHQQIFSLARCLQHSLSF